MFDALSIIFWTFAYVLAIISLFLKENPKGHKMPPIPFPSIVLNLTWEFTAMCLYHHWGQILWFIVDLIIAYCSYDIIKERKNKFLYLISIAVSAVAFRFIFKLNYGMLYSSFAIDLIMALLFLIQVKQMSFKMRIPIACTKLLGDLSALIYYANQSKLVLATGVLVLVINISYLLISIHLVKSLPQKNNGKKIRRR